LSFLVLITTAAGFYWVRAPGDWAAQVHTVFGSDVDRGGTAALESLYRGRGRLRPADEKNRFRVRCRASFEGRVNRCVCIALSIAGALYLYFRSGNASGSVMHRHLLGYFAGVTPF